LVHFNTLTFRLPKVEAERGRISVIRFCRNPRSPNNRTTEIRPLAVHKWRSELDRKEAEAFPGSGHETPNAELETLRRENKRLREERDILKKSLGFFARDASLGTDSSGNPNENSK
jgi:transposase